MSLIADSLKKASREKAPRRDAGRDTPLMGGSRPPRPSKGARVVRFILLILIPCSVLGSLLYVAFSGSQRALEEKSPPIEEANTTPAETPETVFLPPGPGGKPPTGEKVPEPVREPVKERLIRGTPLMPKAPTPPAADAGAGSGSIPGKKIPRPVEKPAAPVAKEAAPAHEPSAAPEKILKTQKPVAVKPEKARSAARAEESGKVREKPAASSGAEQPAAPLRTPAASGPRPQVPAATHKPRQPEIAVLPRAVEAQPLGASGAPVAPVPPAAKPHHMTPVESPAGPLTPQTFAPPPAEERAGVIEEESVLEFETVPSGKPGTKSAAAPDRVSGGLPSAPAPAAPGGARENVAALKLTVSKPDGKDAPKKVVFEDSVYHFNRGVFYQQARQWDEALAEYQAAARLNPENADAYNNLGVVYKARGELDRAIKEFLRAVYLDPGYSKAYNNIGVVYYMKQDFDGAIRNYEKAIEARSDNLEAFNNLALVYRKKNEPQKALGVLNQALAANPEHAGTNYNLAVLYENHGELQPAIHYYRRFLQLGERSHPALVLQVRKHLETIDQ
ncbi:MAG: tetratricopeptide repeat protein [Nitrospinaceae bacterium]|nr:MAG: tetratricopeptide repeat protein [Nitrospinaceae bacterium]